MATVGWRSDHPLSRCVREDCAQFDWYQLVRLLLIERAAIPMVTALDAHVRFRGDLSLAFPANEVTGVLDTGGPVTVTTPNYSVAGYLGPLPESISEWARERRAAGDRAMADFLDLFNHRIGSFRYRAKARLHPALGRQQPEQAPLAGKLAAIVGVAEPEVMRQLPVPIRALLGVAGLLANRRRNPDTIERVLRLYLGTPVQIVSFLGAWQRVPAAERTLLGKRNSVLGKSTALGERMWDQAAAIEVRIGPLMRTSFRELLPDGSRHAALTAMLRFLTDAQVDCRVRLSTPAAENHPATLSGRADDSNRLGRTTWISRAVDGLREATFIVRARSAEDARAA